MEKSVQKFNREELRYRNGVVAYIIDGLGNILLVQKTTYPDHLWTFPGGGVEEGEDLLQALFRELEEEIYTKEQLYKLVGKSTKTLDYEWDDNTVSTNIEKKGSSYRGQKNHQFVLKYLGDRDNIKPNEEEKIKVAKWVPISDIEEYLNFEGQKESVRPVLVEFSL
ncbi:NUDIX domain-containing protein [bacterium]|nr:NUDIX domain-containing protein [bacterium]